MASDSKEPDRSPFDRPLPVVDMPLLREQRRASALRQLMLAGAAVLLLAGGVTAAVLSLDDDELEEETFAAATPDGGPRDAAVAVVRADDAPLAAEEGDEVEPTPEVAVETVETAAGSQRERRTTTFGQATSFRHAMARAGLSEDERAALEEALTEVLDFRRCRPEDVIIIDRDAAGVLTHLEYHDSAQEYVVVDRQPDGTLEAERVERPVERVRLARGGTVRTSIGDALERAGLGRSLVGVFVEVFAAKANFNTNTHVGDTFRIIVDEERVEGELQGYGAVHALEYVGQRTGTLRAFRFEEPGERPEYFDETGRSVHGSWLRPPLRYDHISSRFDPRRMHPILRRVVPHTGVDYAASTGTPVWAAADGVVTWAGPKGANGNLVAIRHDGGYRTFYAHLHRIQSGIERGVRVEQRQIIGQVGTTGRSTGPHLHFGLKRNGQFMDPLEIINGPGRMLPAGLLASFRRAARRLGRELDAIEVSAAQAEGSGGRQGSLRPDPTRVFAAGRPG